MPANSDSRRRFLQQTLSAAGVAAVAAAWPAGQVAAAASLSTGAAAGGSATSGGRRLRAPRLGVGTLVLGERDNPGSDMQAYGCDVDEAFRILDVAFDRGARYFDTADVYGGGFAETLVGRWLRERGRRLDVVVGTKGGFYTAGNPGSRGSRRHLMSAVEHSLRRLGVEQVDLYQLHAQDLSVPEEETLRALQDMRDSGKVRAFGVSNYAAWRLMESLWTSDRMRVERVVGLQAKYNLVRRGVEMEHVPLCVRHGLDLLCWAPLAEGFLSGKYAFNAPMPVNGRLACLPPQYARYATAHGWRTLDGLRRVAMELGHTPAQVSLAWLLAKPWVSCALVGARTARQMEENLGAFEIVLPEDALAFLDQVSLGTLEYPYSYFLRDVGDWQPAGPWPQTTPAKG